jgi:hypothetical protein
VNARLAGCPLATAVAQILAGGGGLTVPDKLPATADEVID